MRRIVPVAAVGTAICAFVAVGCSTGATGARREGPAPSATIRKPAAREPAIAGNMTALARLVRMDSTVSADVRQDLTPCPDEDYPMDTDSGDLTSGDGPDLVVNISTCKDDLGVAAYVYRMIGGKYQNVFADEREPVYASVVSGHLEIIHAVYGIDDPISFPTGQESFVYAWRGNHFVEVARSFSDFAAPTPSASPEPTEGDWLPAPSATLLDPGLVTATATPPTTGAPSPDPGPTPSLTPAPAGPGPGPTSATPPLSPSPYAHAASGGAR